MPKKAKLIVVSREALVLAEKLAEKNPSRGESPAAIVSKLIRQSASPRLVSA